MKIEMMETVRTVTLILEKLSTLFIFVIGLVVLVVIDINQSKSAIVLNYPVVGHLRSIFSKFRRIFRKYFFTMDREEVLFNRAERDWVHKAANNNNATVAFGSTKNINPVGTVLFTNCPFPTLDEDAVETHPVTIGRDFCKQPYQAKSVFNISGMSFDAISRPEVLALSNGAARMANCWYNTALTWFIALSFRR